MDGIAELAKLFKERENKQYGGPQLGKVVTVPPDIKISLGDKIILTKKHLIIADHVVAGMLLGDIVIIIPSADGQQYYLVDKAVKL